MKAKPKRANKNKSDIREREHCFDAVQSALSVESFTPSHRLCAMRVPCFGMYSMRTARVVYFEVSFILDASVHIVIQ